MDIMYDRRRGFDDLLLGLLFFNAIFFLFVHPDSCSKASP